VYGVSAAPVKAVTLSHLHGLHAKEPVVNTLSTEKQTQILSLLVESSSIRSIERVTGVHRDTIVRLLARAGSTCARLMDEKVTDLKCEDVEVDEIWGYVAKKQRHIQPQDNPYEVGDQYVFIAMDAKSKVVCSYVVGKRSLENAVHLMRDLQYRVTGRITLTTDGFTPYITAVEKSFGSNVDFGQLVKVYRGVGGGRYSPPEFVSATATQITGNSKRISTSYIERQNLTIRMQMRRFTRLTNAFSKKLASMKAAVALHFAHYNFMRIHRTLRVTPAMQAGLTDHVWSWGELLSN
jgi:IS1 family transposase